MFNVSEKMAEWVEFMDSEMDLPNQDDEHRARYAQVIALEENRGYGPNLEQAKDGIESYEFTPIAKSRLGILGCAATSGATAIIFDLSDRIGDMVMYISYLAWKAHEKDKGVINEKGLREISAQDILDLCNGKLLSQDALEKVWDKQKLSFEERDMPLCDNMLDLLSAENMPKQQTASMQP